jgi:hypothetical protein
MDYLVILKAQLVDPFRIGLLIMLMVTAVRTAANVGTAIPLALGTVFVAVIIPLTLSPDDGNLVTRIALGLVANVIILAVLMAGRALFARLTATKK